MTPDTQVLIPTYTVVSRHSAECPHKEEGREYVQCNCKKHICVYDPRAKDPQDKQYFRDANGDFIKSKKGKRVNLIPAKTRSYRDAEIIAQAYRDQHDPNVRARREAEAKVQAMQAKEAARTATIQKAVAMFYASKKTDGTSLNRIKRYYPLLGNIDPNTFAFVSVRQRGRGGKGRLFEWLETLTPRPVHVSDLTTLVDEFRSTWNFGSDQTRRLEYSNLKEFFKFCVTKRWIDKNPLDGIKAPIVQPGSRTTAFSDQQYDAIIATIKSQFPIALSNGKFKNLEEEKQYNDAHRLLAFVELMRWGGLALEDAVRFELSSMQDDGEVSYKRVKTYRRTGRKATPVLLPHVVSLLRATVPIDGNPNQPFYDKNVVISTNKNRWSTAVKEVCFAAGIDLVKTDIRDREPHCHMFRDTFAVNRLITQYKTGQIDHEGIADELGDTEAVFLKHYTPLIEKLKKVKKDARHRIANAQAAEWEQKQKQDKVTNIAGGRR
jgi:integrase